MIIKILKKYKSVFAIGYLAILTFFIYKRSDELNISSIIQELKNCDIQFILSALVIQIFIISLLGLNFKKITLLISKKKIPVLQAIKIQYLSWLNKYIPGKVGIAATKIYFLGQKKIKLEKSTLIVFYENMFTLLSAIIVGVPIIIFFFGTSILNQFYLYSAVAILIILTILSFSKNLSKVSNIILRILKRPNLEKSALLSTKENIYILLHYSIIPFLSGLVLFLIVNSIFNWEVENFIPGVGIITISGIIGLLAIFAPAGLGVLEGVLILFLSQYFEIEDAVLISVIYRGLTFIADFIIFILWSLLSLIKPNPV